MNGLHKINIKMIFQIILLILFKSMCFSSWSLFWNDEFDHARLNFEAKMWDIEDTGNRCKEPFDSQLNCMSARDENVRTVEGNLAITAIYQDKPTPAYKKPFTSAYIYSAEYFTQGKFEVRAAMPKGKFLRAQINLYEPEERDNTWSGIAIVDYKQGDKFEIGVWELGGNFSHYISYEPGVNLSDYHIYSLEREEGFLRWYFDGNNYYNYSFNDLGDRLNKRLNGEMEIDVNLVVGGPKMSDNWTLLDVQDWKCPSIIVDYVRVYERTEEQGGNKTRMNKTEKSPEEICTLVKELRFKNSTSSSQDLARNEAVSALNLNYLVIPVIMILVIVIGILIRKLKQHKKQILKMDEQGKKGFDSKLKDENFYSNINESEYEDYTEVNLYEQIGDKNNNYEETYLEVYDDIKVNSKEEQPRYETMNKDFEGITGQFHGDSVYV